MSDLVALAERVEAATGADRVLDVLIGCAVGYVPDLPGCAWAKEGNWRYIPVPRMTERIGCADKAGNVAAHWEAPRYTSSLDAAMSLVPASDELTAVFWRVGNDGEGGDPSLFKATVLACHGLTSQHFDAVADTAPLALTAAALRARSPNPLPKDQ